MKGGIIIKKFINWFNIKGLSVVASLALLVTMTIENRVCLMYFHQDKLPESAKKLRKF